MNKKIEKAVLASLRQAVAIREGTARPAKRYTLASRTALPRDRALRDRNGPRVLAVLFTDRGADLIRVISARPATPRERRKYEKDFR